MVSTHTARGTNTTMTLTHNADELYRKLKRLNLEGEKIVNARLFGYIQHAIREIKGRIKKMAGNSGGSIPSGLGWKSSKTIHDRVSDALKVNKTKKNTYTIHTGKNVNEAKLGVKGQRGGLIGAILAKGMDPFQYGKLPPEVRSSIKWYKSSGFSIDTTHRMKARGNHPGFLNTLDYMGLVQQRTKEIFESDMPLIIEGELRRRGFFTNMNQIKQSAKRSLKGTRGGTGRLKP